MCAEAGRASQHVGRAGQAARRIGLAQKIVVERHVGCIAIELESTSCCRMGCLAMRSIARFSRLPQFEKRQERDARIMAHLGVRTIWRANGGRAPGRWWSR